MGILFWIIGAIAIAVFRTALSGKLRPSGHRSWPPKPHVNNRPQETSHPTVQHTFREINVPDAVQAPVSTVPAPEYQNEKRRQPEIDTERVFAGESGYDRMGSLPVGRPVRRSSPIAFHKDDLVRAIVMSEVLGPPRARRAKVIHGNRRKP